MSSAYEIVNIARRLTRPTSLEYIEKIFHGFIEFHGDRACGDDSAIVGGVAFLNNLPITVISIQKGKTLEENIHRNFGQVKPEGYRKALRLMKQAEKFNRPIICFVNTSGAFCGVEAEERGQGEAIAKNLMEMSALKVPIISIITGEGGSGGALALSVSDRVWILKNAIYSILSPEGFASILWKDSKRASEAAEFMRLTSNNLLEMKIVDKIIDEDPSGIENNFQYTIDILKAEIINELNTLRSLQLDELLENRYERFRKFGETKELKENE